MRRHSLLLLVPVLLAAGLALAGRSPAPDNAPPPARTERAGKRTGAATGAVQVTDGDTLRIGDSRIRLHGIDAPERAQSCDGADGQSYRCGEEATAALDPADRWQPPRLRRTRPRPLRPQRGGLLGRRAGPQPGDGRRGLGARLHAIFPGL